jgi:hypothetical protein
MDGKVNMEEASLNYDAKGDGGAYATKPAAMTNVPIAAFLLAAQFLGFPSSPSVKCTGGAERCPIITFRGAFTAWPDHGSSLVTGLLTPVYVVASEHPAFSSIREMSDEPLS